MLGSLVNPRAGFRTLSAGKRGVVPFKTTDVSERTHAFVSSREVCDGAIYEYSATLLTARLRALDGPGRRQLAEFERRVQVAKTRR